MPSCELCGQDADSLTKVKIEGATLKVCGSCTDMGEKVGSKSRNRSKKRSSQTPRNQEVLVDDYGTRIKEAREEEGIAIKELADELNEKTSLLSKIERQELKPDNTLAGKISDRLGIKLYTNPEVYDHDAPSSDSRKATLGDVAEVKD